MSVQRIASRYAKSLVDLAAEQKKLDRVAEDIRLLQNLVSHRELYLLLKSPIIKADKKQQILDGVFDGKLDPMTSAFMDILVRKGREGYLPEIADAFIEQYKHLKHISTVKLTTAAQLSDAVIADIRRKLESSDATDEVIELVTEVRPSLLGGFIIEFDGRLYDTSVANKLEELKREFRDNLYISQIIAR
ncbi:MAG: ATP synthase F1 subunit delta [Phaeodactylibacter sp.]|nr:ATP synthase F1 subunit delta [Phaeodactylibacter sp.]MCB0630909.1 ATP synthase F1 subunit delta [Lewinella sp.]MCB9276691.1 ATP synthase F1 subunit delta [Lewinellaceae bacterium]